MTIAVTDHVVDYLKETFVGKQVSENKKEIHMEKNRIFRGCAGIL